MADSSHRWFLALGVSALLLSTSLGGLAVLRQKRARAATRPPPTGDCGPQRSEFHPLPDADSPPVILWAAGKARLFIDEKATFSAPENPKRFERGDHFVRIEAPGEETLRTVIRVDAFTPALLHAQSDPEVGLSLVRLGVGCLPCGGPATPVDLSPVHRPGASFALLQAAAGHLRYDRWPQAAEAIRSAAGRDRGRPLFFRLAAITAADGGQPELARALLQRIPPERSSDLRALLPVLDRLAASEAARRREVSLARWNKLTEWFATIGDRYQRDASAPVTAATRRFAQLSQLFDAAVREGSLQLQEDAVRAGEETLQSVVQEIRALRPQDCQFQQGLTAVAAQ